MIIISSCLVIACIITIGIQRIFYKDKCHSIIVSKEMWKRTATALQQKINSLKFKKK